MYRVYTHMRYMYVQLRNAIQVIFRPIPIFVAMSGDENDYVKILQAKYFTGENIPIYGNLYYNYYRCTQLGLLIY